MRTQDAGRDVDAIKKTRNIREKLTWRGNGQFKMFADYTLFMTIMQLIHGSKDLEEGVNEALGDFPGGPVAKTPCSQ